ncbi:hypothetical protein [Alkaliphilus sp. B6464]|nr:hypothetical protein [Alkaliphilus sp. B6464]
MSVKELIELLSKLDQEKEIRYVSVVYDDVEITEVKDWDDFYMIF